MKLILCLITYLSMSLVFAKGPKVSGNFSGSYMTESGREFEFEIKIVQAMSPSTSTHIQGCSLDKCKSDEKIILRGGACDNFECELPRSIVRGETRYSGSRGESDYSWEFDYYRVNKFNILEPLFTIKIPADEDRQEVLSFDVQWNFFTPHKIIKMTKVSTLEN